MSIADIEVYESQPIEFTEVTLRDGEQQEKRYPEMPIPDRIDVFEACIDAGVTTIEIGHLGNDPDIELASAIVKRIKTAEALGSTRYEDVSLQILFGSQKDLIEKGTRVFDDFDKDRVIVHVYDRVAEYLRILASDPYTISQSAERVAEAAHIAADYGFNRFSISGEGAIDPLTAIELVTDFYTQVGQSLQKRGITAINFNLANTFGLSITESTPDELAFFDTRSKTEVPGATTSVHVHNDHTSAAEFAVAAITAGFDKVEGTMIGMGERAGNVALVDVVVRLLENARANIERQEAYRAMEGMGRVAVGSSAESIWKTRHIDPKVMTSIDRWHDISAEIADIYDTGDRFAKTSLGNPAAYAAGSGPHAHANREFARDPINKPLWRSYGWSAIVHAMMGRKEAREILAVDKERIKRITLETHAAGGSTRSIHEDKVIFASDEDRKVSEKMAWAVVNSIFDRVAPHVSVDVSAIGDSGIREHYSSMDPGRLAELVEAGRVSV